MYSLQTPCSFSLNFSFGLIIFKKCHDFFRCRSTVKGVWLRRELGPVSLCLALRPFPSQAQYVVPLGTNSAPYRGSTHVTEGRVFSRQLYLDFINISFSSYSSCFEVNHYTFAFEKGHPENANFFFVLWLFVVIVFSQLSINTFGFESTFRPVLNHIMTDGTH